MPKQAQEMSLYPNDKGIDLDIFQCVRCKLVQLNCSPVPYYTKAISTSILSKETQSFRELQLKSIVNTHSLKNKSILDIGKSLNENVCLSAGFGEYKSSTGISTSYEKKFDFFISCNYFEHCPFPNIFLNFINQNTKENSIGIIEVPNFDMICENGLFAEIIPDHLFYFTKDTLNYTLSSGGFRILENYKIKDDYILGAIIQRTQDLSLESFDKQKRSLKKQFNKYFKKYKKIAIYGAGHQAFALISLLNLKNIEFIVDDAEFKQNRYSPASNIKILPSFCLNKNIEAILVVGGSYSEEISKKLLNDKATTFEGDIFILDKTKIKKM
jgi:hypothetical protein